MKYLKSQRTGRNTEGHLKNLNDKKKTRTKNNKKKKTTNTPKG